MKIFLFLLIVIFTCVASPCMAHKMQVKPVVSVIRVQDSVVSVELKGNAQDIYQAIAGVRSDGPVTQHRKVSPEELNQYTDQHLVITVGDTRLKGNVTRIRIDQKLDPTRTDFDVMINYVLPKELKSDKLTIRSSLFDYLPNAITIVSAKGIQKTLRPSEEMVLNILDARGNLIQNIWDFFKLGADHIFTGYDHLLFIIALMLVSTSLKQLVKTLTGFTIAHSVTLILSVLSVVTLPERFTDIMIALSIVYVGLENIFVRTTRHRFWIASAFGLIHGFGFSTILRNMGLPEDGLALCLLSFNLGVEAAQVAVCAVAFPLLLRYRKGVLHRQQYGAMSWDSVVRLLSCFVVAFGAFWAMQRIFGG